MGAKAEAALLLAGRKKLLSAKRVRDLIERTSVQTDDLNELLLGRISERMSETNGHGILVPREAVIELLALVEAAARTLGEVSPFDLDSFFSEAGDQVRREVFGLEGAEWAGDENAAAVYARAAEIEADALELVTFTNEVDALRNFAAQLRERLREAA